jgi:beta-aspartyl-peptidase (threonine type)
MSVLAIHGGCGVLARSELTEAEWAEARDHLAESLRAGWAVLKAGGRALDAVQAAVIVMEDSPHFNAGHGAALNHDGEHELDSSIMDGATLAAGAVVAARRIRNPVKAARAVLDSGTLAMLAGPAADVFAGDQGLELVDPSYFTTARRLENLQSLIRRGQDGTYAAASEGEKHGTVGAVALDAEAHLAAATSTGGYTNKPAGRVGDSPIIGAGTYALDGACAVSGTGQGEYFIRHVLGHEIASRIAYLGQSLATASEGVLADLSPYKIGAGLVSVDAKGEIAAPFNTAGMFRGWVTADGEACVGTHMEVFAVRNFGG